MTIRSYSYCIYSFLISALLLTSYSLGRTADAQELPSVITYSAAYRVKSANMLELGIVSACGDAWCMKMAKYDGGANLPRVPTAYRHIMNAPYRSKVCQEQQIGTITPSALEEYKVILKKENNGFLLEAGQFQYQWVGDSNVVDAYVLSRVTQSGSSEKIDQVVGFAFVSVVTIVGPIKASQLLGRFNGELFHKNYDMGQADDWLLSPSTIDFRKFAETSSGEVLMDTRPGQADVIKKYGKQMWQHSSLILSRDEQAMSPLVQEYGHDFNMNGCFDEPGHNKLLLPVADGSSAVKAFVYIEYTPNYKSRMPMISVGRYYR